jgi:hypothetical protein
MIRRLLVVFAVLAATVVLSTPVSAQPPPLPCNPTASGNGAAGCTVHFTNVPFAMDVTSMTCPNGTVIPGGALSGSFSMIVFHITINKAGDLWATSTEVATFTLIGDNGVTYTGHLEGWFGESLNRSNVVFHNNFNVTARGSDGSTLGFHALMHFSTNANNVVVALDKLTCT